MSIRALLRISAVGVSIVASTGTVATNTTGRQTVAALTKSTIPTWTQTAQIMPRARPLVAQLFMDSRGEQAARIRAQMERMEACVRADDRLNGRIQSRDGDGRGDQQQQECMHQERGNGDQGNWHDSRRG